MLSDWAPAACRSQSLRRKPLFFRSPDNKLVYLVISTPTPDERRLEEESVGLSRGSPKLSAQSGATTMVRLRRGDRLRERRIAHKTVTKKPSGVA